MTMDYGMGHLTYMIFPYWGRGIHSQDINIQGTPCFWSIARGFLSVDNVLVKGIGQLSTKMCQGRWNLCHWSIGRSLCQWFSETDCICNSEAKKWMRCSQHLTVLRGIRYTSTQFGDESFFFGAKPVHKLRSMSLQQPTSGESFWEKNWRHEHLIASPWFQTQQHKIHFC